MVRKSDGQRWGLLVALGALMFSIPVVRAAGTIIHKTAENFESAPWIVDHDSRAKGKTSLMGQVPALEAAISKKAMEIEASFSGEGGFEFLNVLPTHPLMIPGQAKRITMWVKGDGKNPGWAISFRDGWGRSEVAGKKLDWSLAKELTDEWRKVSFDIPQGWVQPISIAGFVTHNWGQQGTKYSARIWADQISVDTDISDVDEATGVLRSWKPNPQAKPGVSAEAPKTPLLATVIAGSALHNVFVVPETPAFSLSVQSWKAKAVTGNLKWKVSDSAGASLLTGQNPLRIEDVLDMALPIEVKKFGLYQFEADLQWDGGTTTHVAQSFAVLPPPVELSAMDKDQSPYGLNVLAARKPMVETFRKAGIIWYRDYGFDYDWMLRAKGADKSYGGWPFYPKFVGMYDAHDVRVLACMEGAIRQPRPASPNIG